MMQKRGLSDVVTTVLVILLVVVAVGAIWAFVQRMIQQTEQQVVTDKFTSGFSIPPASMHIAKLNPDIFLINFLLKRNEGESDVVAANVIVQDNSGKSVTKRINIPNSIKQFETQKISLAVNGISNVKTISVVPIVKDSNNREVNALAEAVFDSASHSVSGDAGLVGYWTFDEDSGTTAADMSSNDFDGTLSGTPLPSHILSTSGKCKVGGCLEFSGNNYVDIAANFNLRDKVGLFGGGGNKGVITISAWIKPTDLNNAWRLFVNGFPGLFYLGINSNTKKLVAMTSLGGDVNYWPTSTKEIPRDIWTHVIFILEGGKGYKFYINGVLDNPVTEPRIDLKYMAGGENTGLGRSYQNVPSEFFRGYMDEVMIFNRTLSDDEINMIYESTK